MAFSAATLGTVDPTRPETFMSNSYPAGFDKMTIPEGTSGDWSVQRFTVTQNEGMLSNLRLIRDRQFHRVVPPGTYTKLVHKGEGVVMSDTPAEAHEHAFALRLARDHVLLNGLGLRPYVSNAPKARKPPGIRAFWPPGHQIGRGHGS